MAVSDTDGGQRMSAEGVHPLAGKPAPESLLVNGPRLVTAYYAEQPDPSEATQRPVFGTSGHRGSSLQASFNEAHVLAATQAICLYRRPTGSTARSSSAGTPTPPCRSPPG